MPTSRTVLLTFDNLGEAAEVDPHAPLGPPRGHPSVDVALPRLLDLLDELALRATFFVEAVNAERYPAAVTAIVERGHEIGQHAWRHERWGELDGATQAELLERSTAAFAELGIAAEGFRPPGGGLGEGGLERLWDAGLTWCSPEGGRARLEPAGPAVLPFRWPLVDATYVYEPLAALRVAMGLGEDPLDGAEGGRRLRAEIEADPDPVAATLILHPFLAVRDDVGAAHERLLRDLAAQREGGALRIATGGELAGELRGWSPPRTGTDGPCSSPPSSSPSA